MEKWLTKIVCNILFMLVLFPALPLSGAEVTLNDFDQKVLEIATGCKNQVVTKFEELLNTGQLTVPQLFDTFYIPIPDTYPQKFHTSYDQIADKVLPNILDGCLKENSRFVYVVTTDRNGYIPTHNSKYSQPLTGDLDTDSKNNRTKRLFNDRTGLAAARNTNPHFLQRYSRDTGEVMSDLSLPIMIREKHWGALRIGYK